jgi:hypothetical protein
VVEVEVDVRLRDADRPGDLPDDLSDDV